MAKSLNYQRYKFVFLDFNPFLKSTRTTKLGYGIVREDCKFSTLLRSKQILPSRSLLLGLYMVSRYTRKSNFIHAYKESTALLKSIFMKTQTFSTVFLYRIFVEGDNRYGR